MTRTSQKNIIDKIWDQHVIHSATENLDILFIDLQLLHEVTSPQAFHFLAQNNLPVRFPSRQWATMDHSVPTDEKRQKFVDSSAQNQLKTLAENCHQHGIFLADLHSSQQGIVHVASPELGLTQPGMTLVCGDSHTSTHGAIGALAFGIGTTEVGYVLATQTLLLERPKTMNVRFVGTPKAEGFAAKDAILSLIRQIGIQGATKHVIEYTGDYIRALSIEGRLTVCNMSIEAGARGGLVSPDEMTLNYLQDRPFLKDHFSARKGAWQLIASDPAAEYDQTITVDLEDARPLVTWGTNPEQSITLDETIPTDFSTADKALAAEKALEYNGLKKGDSLRGVPVDYVFIGSCTNARLSDLRIVADILRGKKVSPQTEVSITPGSHGVYEQAEKEGLLQVFKESGATVRRPGCSMCIAMNGDLVPAGKRCASTSNRNFVGRQGKGSFTHLMSPYLAAHTALAGVISDGR